MEGLCNVARCSLEDCRGEKGYVKGARQVESAVLLEVFVQVEGTHARSETGWKCCSSLDELTVFQSLTNMARAYSSSPNAHEM